MAKDNKGFELDGSMFLWGAFFGLLAGWVAALLTAPKSGPALRHEISTSVNETTQTLRARVEAVVPSDPVAESLAEGKAAARRRKVLTIDGEIEPPAPVQHSS